MYTIIAYLLARLSERSTYVGLIGIATAIGCHHRTGSGYGYRNQRDIRRCLRPSGLA